MTEYLNKLRFSEDNRKKWDSCFKVALEESPDKIYWTDSATGYHCLMHRGESGVWCGYVAVDESHALYGRSFGGLHERELEDYFYQGLIEVIGRDYLPPNYYSSPIDYTKYVEPFRRYEDENKGIFQPETFRKNYWYIGFTGGPVHPSTSDRDQRQINERNEWPPPKYWCQQQIFYAVRKLAAELKTLEHVNFKYFDTYVTKMKINDDYEEDRRERESKRKEEVAQASIVFELKSELQEYKDKLQEYKAKDMEMLLAHNSQRIKELEELQELREQLNGQTLPLGETQ